MGTTSRPLIPLELLRQLPKAELHCHLDGSARVSTIIELAKEQGVKLPTFDLEELTRMVTVDFDCKSLEEYLVGFDITLKVMQKSYAITRVMYEVAEDAVKDGIPYLEVRFSPVLHIQEGLTLSAVMEAVMEGRAMAEYRLPIKVNIIVCGMRHMSSEVSQDLAEICWRYRHKGVVAFDLAGPEFGFSSKDHRKAFGIVRNKLINCTLHSGEGAGWESVQDSIQYCGAHRLGHGVRLTENPELLQYVVDNGIAIESCVTSNMQTKATDSLENHPIRKFFDAGVLIVPCTDNPTVSGVTLSGEYNLIQKHFGFTPTEIVKLIDNGFAAAFMDVTTKRRTRAEVLKQCIMLLKQNGFNVDDIVNDPYYDIVGVDLKNLGVASPQPYWHGVVNPEITRELIEALPKTDLHCKLDGGMDLKFLWGLYTDEDKKWVKKNLKVELENFDTFQSLISQEEHNEASLLLAKRLLKVPLQTKENIKRAIHNVVENAVKEGVLYLEIVVRFRTHTRRGLTEEEVLQTVLEGIKAEEEQFKDQITLGLVVYVSASSDDPIAFFDAAKLAVKYKTKGVSGFAAYGDEEIAEHNYKYYLTTFHYLKANNMNVAMASGIHSVGSIVTALHEGGARRISGAFSIHNFPRLMNYVANHSVPVEISLSAKLRLYSKNIESFAQNPIRLFLDNDIPATICSFRGAVSPYSRSDIIYEVVKACNLTPRELVVLLSNGIRFNFQSKAVREVMLAKFQKTTSELMDKHGARFYSHRNSYFPADELVIKK